MSRTVRIASKTQRKQHLHKAVGDYRIDDDGARYRRMSRERDEKLQKRTLV
jgi:hypothetical protein